MLPSCTSTSNSTSYTDAENSNVIFLNDYTTSFVSSNFPDKLWYEAIVFATLLHNTIINSTTKMSPRSKVDLCNIDTSTIFPFGFKVVILKHNISSEFEERSVDSVALRPLDKSNGYQIYLLSIHSIINTSKIGTYKFIEPATPSAPGTNIFGYFFTALNNFSVKESNKFSSFKKYFLDILHLTITITLTTIIIIHFL